MPASSVHRITSYVSAARSGIPQVLSARLPPLQDQQRNVDKVMRAEECSFVRTLQQSRPVLDAQPGEALTAVQAMAVQVRMSAVQRHKHGVWREAEMAHCIPVMQHAR